MQMWFGCLNANTVFTLISLLSAWNTISTFLIIIIYLFFFSGWYFLCQILWSQVYSSSALYYSPSLSLCLILFEQDPRLLPFFGLLENYFSSLFFSTCFLWFYNLLKQINLINITQELIVIVASLKLGSVSDLLDYINPSHDAKGRDAAAKRKNYIVKVVDSCISSHSDVQLVRNQLR